MADAAVTTLRRALCGQLKTVLLNSGLVDDTFEIVAGRLEGPQVDKDIGCVWTEDVEEDPDQKALELIDLRLRVFKRFYASRGADLKPYDPSPLEAIGEAVQTAFNGNAGSNPATFAVYNFRVIRQEFLLDEQAVEISILGTHGNLAVRAAAV